MEGGLDERRLIQSLKSVRQLVEIEHALEVERAGSVPAWPFTGARQMGGRQVLLRGDGSAASFSAGDAVEIGAGGAALFGSVVRPDAEGLVVELGGGRQTTLPGQGMLRLRVDDNQRTIRLRAVERVVRERQALSWIGPVLADAQVAPHADSDWKPAPDSRLTPGQRLAIDGATAARDVFLIQGPPGTGKTTVIAELVRFFTHERGARVLLSSKGHRAIDNVLDRHR